jgi:hypothetical protein
MSKKEFEQLKKEFFERRPVLLIDTIEWHKPLITIQRLIAEVERLKKRGKR